MGKQYNKVIKRRRRAAYIAKRKAAVKELVSKSSKGASKAKPAKAKVTRKAAAPKKAKVVEKTPEPVAEKANPTDVIGTEEASNASATKEAPKEAVAVKEEKPQEESKDSAES
ncbi:MAG: hypothetical protein ACJZ64_06710 [Opitutales bacterium]|tara:strand:+ start:2766 stop:3104 length:339 start_codon:yes stop_codon:yes gene_type:complete